MWEMQMVQEPQPETSGAYELFLQAHPARGSLRVQVSAARGAFPVPGALVEVSRDFDGVRRVLYKGVTNSSGILEGMVLPALPVDYSRQESTAADSGTAYRVSVYHPAFVPLQGTQIMVYGGIETILPVALQPLVR